MGRWVSSSTPPKRFAHWGQPLGHRATQEGLSPLPQKWLCKHSGLAFQPLLALVILSSSVARDQFLLLSRNTPSKGHRFLWYVEPPKDPRIMGREEQVGGGLEQLSWICCEDRGIWSPLGKS